MACLSLVRQRNELLPSVSSGLNRRRRRGTAKNDGIFTEVPDIFGVDVWFFGIRYRRLLQRLSRSCSFYNFRSRCFY